MKDFIVWDDASKQFYDNKNSFYENDAKNKCVLLNGQVLIFVDEEYESGVYYPYKEKGKLIALWDIGIKDINSKKIYSDCSIVEFDYLVDFENEIFQKRIGVFYFEKTFLAYHTSFLTGTNRKGGNADKYNAFGMKNFKIIDTIQENKMGLIK